MPRHPFAAANGAHELFPDGACDRGGPLNGIRALFADEVFVKSLTADYEEGELERLIAALGERYQPALNRFAQAAVGRYLNELAEEVVQFEGAADEPE